MFLHDRIRLFNDILINAVFFPFNFVFRINIVMLLFKVRVMGILVIVDVDQALVEKGRVRNTGHNNTLIEIEICA